MTQERARLLEPEEHIALMRAHLASIRIRRRLPRNTPLANQDDSK